MKSDARTDDLRRRLSAAIEKSTYNVTSLARAVDRDKDYFRNFLSGKKATIGAEERDKAERLLNLKRGYLAEAVPADQNSSAPHVSEPPAFEESGHRALLSELPIDVPVLGSSLGEKADYSIASNKIISRVRRPPGVLNATGVYAVHMTGSSMAPKFEDGELVYVSAERPPALMDYVLIESVRFSGESASRRYIRQLIDRSEAHYMLRCLNPLVTEKFPHDAVKFIHRIFPWSELLAS